MDAHQPICRVADGAQAAPVSFRRSAPPPEIRSFVESLWLFEASAGGGELTDYILPDIGAEVICRMDDRSCAFIRGANPHLEEIAIRQPARYMGARLRPGIGPQLFKVAAEDMRGARLALADVGCPAALYAGRPELQSFAHALVELFRRRNCAGSARIALRAADLLTELHGRLSIDALASGIGCTPRHLHREMVADIGLGPKTVARIARLRRAIALLRTSSRPLAQVAVAAGYCDQAHMTREFSALRAPSPARLKKWRESDFNNTSQRTPR
jgi:AraC-like DNA-binding protein